MTKRRQLATALDELVAMGAIDLRQRAERGDLPCAYQRDREVNDLLAALASRRSVLLSLARRIAAEPQLRDQLLEFQAPQGRIEIESIPLGPSPATTAPRVEPLAEELEWELAEPAPPGPPLSLRQLESGIARLQERLSRHVQSEHFERLVSLKEALLEEMLQPSFWDDQEHAHAVNRTIYHLDRITKQIEDLQRRAEGLSLPPGLARRDTCRIARLGVRYSALEREAALAELELLATDGATVSTTGAHIRILPLPVEGEPGLDGWALTLLGMYEGWAQRHGYEVETEAGAAALVTVRGDNLAPILAGETGIHKRRTVVTKGESRYPRAELARVEVLPLSAGEEPGAALKTAPDPAEVVRVYSFGRSHYVRDPRTGERSNRTRDVLGGDLDAFLLAYLLQRVPESPASG